MHKIKKSNILKIKKTIGKKSFGMDIKYVKVNKRDQDFDLYNSKKEYVTTVDPDRLKMSFEELTGLFEQNEMGIGRPKMKAFKIKRNKVKFTMSPENDPNWYFLPYLTAGEMKEFLNNIDVSDNIMDITSKLIRGEIVTILVPENREPYLKNILKGGASANPYKKVTTEERKILRESLNYEC